MTQPPPDPTPSIGEPSEIFRLAFEHAPIGIVVADPQGILRWVNHAACKIVGRGPHEMIGTSYLDMLVPEGLEEDGRRLQAALESGVPAYTVEHRCVRGDGRTIPIQLDVSLVQDAAGAPRAFVAHIQDIAERTETLEELALAHGEIRASRERFAALVEQSSDLICVVDAAGHLTYVSPAAKSMLGFDDRGWLGFPFLSIVHVADRPMVEAAFMELIEQPAGSGATAAARLLNAEGAWLHVEIAATNRLGDPAVRGVVANVRDVTERAEAAARMTWQAFHDPLTGLPNRALLNDRLTQAVARSGRADGRTAILFLDLDRFKVVNDSFGHEAGDQLLVEVARRLSVTVRSGDTVARLGGDEFVVLTEGMSHEDVLALARRLAKAVAQPIELSQGLVNTSTSIGIAFAAEDVGSAELLRDADTALYRAKERGRNRYHVFSASLRAAALRRVEVDRNLRQALADDRIRVHFQPIVDLTTGEVVAAEALLRVEDEAGNLELPGEYIAVAEDNGLIAEVGQRVLRQACAAMAGWRAQWGERAPLRVAVNISGRQLGSSDFVRQVEDILAEHRLGPGDLSLEFTESTVLTADRETLRTAERLRALGVLLSVDDFGTGYSSLAYLKRFPIGAVKLERMFVGGLGDDPSDAEIIRAVVSLGDALGLYVVAEGIETATQLQMLQHLGCSYGQGFLLSHPMAAEDLDLDAIAGVIGATSAGWAVSGS